MMSLPCLLQHLRTFALIYTYAFFLFLATNFIAFLLLNYVV